MNNIIYLIKFYEMASNETDENTKAVLEMMSQIIQSSKELKIKIRDYLYSLKLTLDQFENIQLILTSLSSVLILFYVKKTELLTLLMKNLRDLHTFEFLEKWFYAFLNPNDKSEAINKKEYAELLANWSEHFYKRHDIFMKILSKLDDFLQAFQVDQYEDIFRQQMILLIYRSGKIEKEKIRRNR